MPVGMLLALHDDEAEIDPAQAASEPFRGPLGLP
jgi:hypothetical protein